MTVSNGEWNALLDICIEMTIAGVPYLGNALAIDMKDRLIALVKPGP